MRTILQIGTTVLHVFASDADAGDNGRVTYSIESADTQDSPLPFAIDPISGVLKVEAHLDREQVESYKLRVLARDQGAPARIGSTHITVEVRDVNDNQPQFDEATYTVHIDENVTLPHPLVTVHATDKDADANGRVRYGIVGGGNDITIDYKTGQVLLHKHIDHKAGLKTVLVRAQDGGQPSLFSKTTIMIHVNDVNDHAPKFYVTNGTDAYRTSIAENAVLGIELMTMKAYDEDSGTNAAITYSLEAADNNELPFAIDAADGVIRVVKPIDREVADVIEFCVIASDGGTPPLRTAAHMLVHVSDINDNAPKFEQSSYNVSMLETAQRGQTVCEVRATDADSTSRLTYKIIGGNDDEHFMLLSVGDSAVLSLNTPLNYQQQSTYVLTVRATDEGTPQGVRHAHLRYAKTTVTVNVVDENEAPHFLSSVHSLKVRESQLLGETLAVIQVC